jgi:hypothetical protein
MMQDLKELKPKIKSHIDQLWKQKWDSLNKGDLYHRISPRIHPEKWRWKTRKAQVVAFKLRLNACNLIVAYLLLATIARVIATSAMRKRQSTIS